VPWVPRSGLLKIGASMRVAPDADTWRTVGWEAAEVDGHLSAWWLQLGIRVEFIEPGPQRIRHPPRSARCYRCP
jgi:hypothetical protein